MKYRREIDGLRAIAVTFVILFHAGFSQISGGFIGVDIFFVISGYLITNIILDEIENEKFSLKTFYERRARRILPALFFVIIICIPFSLYILHPEDLSSFFKSLLAVLVFSSNIFFWRESGYFDTETELKPLLHTWSLGVEEQYYIVFPIFILICCKYFKKHTLPLLLAIFFGSLLLSEILSHQKPAATFYLLPTRAWELMAGSLAAIYTSQFKIELPEKFKSLISIFGLLLITTPAFLYSAKTPFPGIYAIPPTIGTALIIIFSSQRNFVGSFLGNKIFISIGLISYSAYLWHQPIFSFLRHSSIEEPSTTAFSIAILATILLSYFTWKYIETPFRNKERFNQKQIFSLSLVFSFLLAAFSLLYLNGHINGKYKDDPEFKNQFYPTSLRSECDNGAGHQFAEVEFCKFGSNSSKSYDVAVFGDSHSEALIPVFDKIGKDRDFSVIHNGLGGCAPLIGVDVSKGNWNAGVCEKLSEYQLDFVKENNIKVVFLVSRWSLYTQGEYDKAMSGYFLTKSENDERNLESSRRNFETSFKETIKSYNKIGAKIFVIEQVPQQEINPIRIYKKINSSDKKDVEKFKKIILDNSIDYEKHSKHQTYYRDFFKSIQGRDMLFFLNFDSELCKQNKCFIGNEFTSYYKDDDHVNNYGAFLMEKKLSKIFKENNL